MYFSFSIFISDINTVGKVGFNVANYSKEYLGYLAYGYLLILLYPLYKLNFSFIDNIVEKTISFFFLFTTVIIFQSLVVENSMSGKIGDIILSTIQPFIGTAGLWIFVFIGLFVSFIIL